MIRCLSWSLGHCWQPLAVNFAAPESKETDFDATVKTTFTQRFLRFWCAWCLNIKWCRPRNMHCMVGGKLCLYCCRKTAVCIGDQSFDFSVTELVWSQSTFSTDPEVLQNCAGFTLCSSAGLAVGECSAVMSLTQCMLCVQTYCVLCELDYYLLNSKLWIQNWVGLCFGKLCVCWVLLLRVWLLQTINLHRLLKLSNQK